MSVIPVILASYRLLNTWLFLTVAEAFLETSMPFALPSYIRLFRIEGLVSSWLTKIPDWTFPKISLLKNCRFLIVRVRRKTYFWYNPLDFEKMQIPQSWPEWILLFLTIGSEFSLTQIPAIAFSKMSFSSIIPTRNCLARIFLEPWPCKAYTVSRDLRTGRFAAVRSIRIGSKFCDFSRSWYGPVRMNFTFCFGINEYSAFWFPNFIIFDKWVWFASDLNTRKWMIINLVIDKTSIPRIIKVHANL